MVSHPHTSVRYCESIYAIYVKQTPLALLYYYEWVTGNEATVILNGNCAEASHQTKIYLAASITKSLLWWKSNILRVALLSHQYWPRWFPQTIPGDSQ